MALAFGAALLLASIALTQSACSTHRGLIPPGTYPVTVTGTSGATSHSATFNLIVQ